MWSDFDRSHLKKLFEFLKMIKCNLKLSKNSIKHDQLVKNIAYPLKALTTKMLSLNIYFVKVFSYSLIFI